MTSTLISNVRLLDPVTGLDAVGHLGFADGLIREVGTGAPSGRYDEAIDGRGLWLIPGLLDLAARLREPGQTAKASFRTEMPAALASGITGIVLPPDTHPPVDSPAIVMRIQRNAAAAGALDVHVLGALTKGLAGEALSEMSALKQAGCVGVGNAYAAPVNGLIARRALEYARGLDLTVHIFAQDAALAHAGCAHEGPVATRLGLPSIPVAAEVAALRYWISLVEDTGARVHFCRLSSARGAALVEAARAAGLPVTADVAVHQLFLIDEDVDGFNAQCHVIPPVRSREDRDGLRDAVARGVISALCSDHQPHELDAKTNPFPQTEPGISGLETLLPLSLQLVRELGVSPLTILSALTRAPAQICGLPCPGLAPGAPADFVLLDPEAQWTLRAESLLSAGRNTPFTGRSMQGKVLRTWRRGECVHRASAF